MTSRSEKPEPWEPLSAEAERKLRAALEEVQPGGDWGARSLFATLDAERAELARVRVALENLVAEVATECAAPKGHVGPAGNLARDDEPICGRPARWGIITAWTCGEHRRVCDRKEIGEPALRAAFEVLAGASPAACATCGSKRVVPAPCPGSDQYAMYCTTEHTKPCPDCQRAVR